MFRLTWVDIALITSCLEGFFYGIYSGIFVMYLQFQAAKQDTNQSQNVIFYSICILYVLSVALFASDIMQMTFGTLGRSADSWVHIGIAESTLFGCCDFIAQFILIYRCWIVWRRNIRVVIIPSILAMAFLITWIVPVSFTYVASNTLVDPYWAIVVSQLGLALSLTVNALVTGLIIFRIFKVFQEVRTISDDQILGATGGNKLRDIIFILIESGTALFAIQLVRIVIGNVGRTQEIVDIIIGIHEMFNGIIPTFILVRTTMGLSFDEDKSIEEVALGSLHFASNHANSVPEMGSTNVVVDDDRRDDGDIDIQEENDIEIVDR